MNESSCIDSPLRGRAMPKSYSGDLRERVIEAVEGGASRRETAERFGVSVSSAVKWLPRWHERKSGVPKPRGGRVSPLAEFGEEMGRETADVGAESKACLLPPGWCLPTRPRSAQTWRGSGGVLRAATG